MDTISEKKFGQICDGVWHDRAAIFSGRGILSAEAALLRAVYWRVCKAGGEPGQSINRHTLCINDLIRRYRNETVQSR